MATTFEPLYGAETPLTINSLNGLANGSYAGSLVVDNTLAQANGGQLEDALVSINVAAPSSGVSATGTLTAYAYSDVDNAGHYTDNATGTDAVQAGLSSPTNLKTLGPLVNCNVNGQMARGGKWSVASKFGGQMPRKWGIVVLNSCGAALPASGHSCSYTPVNGQGV